MLTRREYAAAAAALGLAPTSLLAQAPPADAAPAAAPGQVTRHTLSRLDYPGEGHATILMLVDIGPGAIVPWHMHPGIESAYLLDGGGFDITVRGATERRVAGGEPVFVPPLTPHTVRNGDRNSRLAITYIVERDKPLAIPVPAPA